MRKYSPEDEEMNKDPPKLKDFEDINFFEDQVTDLTGLCENEL
jgi:hypothetical protein